MSEYQKSRCKERSQTGDLVRGFTGTGGGEASRKLTEDAIEGREGVVISMRISRFGVEACSVPGSCARSHRSTLATPARKGCYQGVSTCARSAIRKDALLCCGSRLRKGEVFAYVGLPQNLKDLKGCYQGVSQLAREGCYQGVSASGCTRGRNRGSKGGRKGVVRSVRTSGFRA